MWCHYKLFPTFHFLFNISSLPLPIKGVDRAGQIFFPLVVRPSLPKPFDGAEGVKHLSTPKYDMTVTKNLDAGHRDKQISITASLLSFSLNFAPDQTASEKKVSPFASAESRRSALLFSEHIIWNFLRANLKFSTDQSKITLKEDRSEASERIRIYTYIHINYIFPFSLQPRICLI